MRITERQLRRIVREALTPAGFVSSTRHSSGWIDPEGEYHFDPATPDHGEWALQKILDLGEERALLGAIRSSVARSIRNGDTELQMPTTDDIREIHRSMSWITEDAASKLLMNQGWAKVTNAYTIAVQRPTRRVLEAWMNLGMESGADPEAGHTIWIGNRIHDLAGWDGIEQFMRGIR